MISRISLGTRQVPKRDPIVPKCQVPNCRVPKSLIPKCRVPFTLREMFPSHHKCSLRTRFPSNYEVPFTLRMMFPSHYKNVPFALGSLHPKNDVPTISRSCSNRRRSCSCILSCIYSILHICRAQGR